MKVVALVSGGKDSCYAMMRCIDYGHEIVALANLMPLDDAVDELDSYMYQTVGHQIVVSYAECMGLPLFRRRIRGSMRHQSLSYAVTPGDEVEDMFVLLNEVKRQIPAIAAVSSGAIASDYQRLRVESVCARLRLVSLAYLWKQDQTILLEEMIRRNIVALTIKVAAMGLNPAKHLGREISDLKLHLLQMKELYGINVCGEGGEYETLTTDCPLFTNARIVLDKFQVILHSPGSIAPVAVLHPLAFHLEHKKEVRNNNESDKMGYVYEVQGETEPVQMVRCQSMDVASATIKEPNLCMSIRRDMFSIGCWSRGSLKSSEDLQEDLTAVLRRIGSQLCDEGFDWVNVLYIHLYISDMNQFALANEVYVKFITEKKCYLGVPSRSTIELPLVHAGLGNAYVEVLVADDRSKKVLHVQSISCWAPSCIGPYSQATLHKEVLYMAGQLGLDPPTMNLCSGGATSEMQQALENCEAVANSFNSSIASAIIFAIYCSTSLTPCERAEIQSTMDNYLQRISNHQTCDPIFVYVSAPNLPKGALVEVKPVLHVPEIGNEVQPILWQTSTTKTPNCWHLEYSEWHDSCCQIHAIRGKICAALVSITKDELANICFKSDQNLADATRESSGKNIKIILRFCIYLLDKILFETDFSWKELTNLRLYFTADLSVTADALSLIISEVFNEFAELTKKIELGKQPMFNLVPVLGSGRSASMDDVVTCELFASKV